MLNRRIFISRLFAGGATVVLSGCGGGASGASSSAPPPVGSAPTPAPAPVPAPPPVPTLRGVTIDDAERSILGGMTTERSWFAADRTAHSETVVRNANELQAAIDAAFDTTANAAVLTLNHRIVLSWNGESTLAAGPAARVVIGRKTLTETHATSGGSVTIAAAAGTAPSLANTVYISAQGVTIEGVGFARQAHDGEVGDTLSAVIVQQNSTYPVESMVRFQRCRFGATNVDLNAASRWVNGFSTLGTIIRYVAFEQCVFRGLQNGAKVVARGAEFDLCDFRSVLQDGIDLFGHRFATDYYAYAAIRRTTFREWADTWESRSEHSDAIQTGTSADRHLGYRVLVSDMITHMSRRYAGEAGLGGGTNSFYNDDHLGADNQFVLRRNICLTNSPPGFAYYSPAASQPSFVDQCTFMRCGVVPSAFAPDATNQDMAVMILGTERPGGPWLKVSDTLAKNGLSAPTQEVALVEVDPRAIGRAPAAQEPEKFFVGRDFARGGAATNGTAGKFGYVLPNEGGSQARFVADVWANFQPRPEYAGKGAPDPRSIPWATA